MDKPLSAGLRPNVWVIWPDQDHLPEELDSAVGLLIKLHSPEVLSYPTSAVVEPCTVGVLSPRTGNSGYLAKFCLPDAPSERPSDDRLRGKDRSSPRWMTLADFRAEFGQIAVSIGDRRAYADIAQRLTPEIARRVLLLANDLVALNELRPSSRILLQVRNSPHDLWSQFFREDEERFALVDFRGSMRAWDLATARLEHVEWLAAEVPLWGGDFVLPLRLNFPEVLGQRQLLNVVIGPNGTGKTTLLLGLAKCVANKDVEIGFEEEFAGRAREDHSWKTVNIVVFTYERAMWAPLRRRGVKVYEQGVRASNWRQLTQLTYEILSSTEEDPDGLRDLRLLREILSGFLKTRELRFPLHPLAQSPSRKSRFFETEISLDDLAASGRGHLTEIVGRLDRRNPPYMRTEQGREYTLSSGERSLALFCARLMIASRGGAFVLIDEPENHLHPRFITLMVQTLARSLQATGSRALLVTHSPFVVREFERSTVKVMKTSAEGVPEMFRPSLQTLGADVTMISDYVFEDEQIRKGFQESIDRAIRTQRFQRSLDKGQLESLAADLGDDAVSYLIERTEAAADEDTDA